MRVANIFFVALLAAPSVCAQSAGTNTATRAPAQQILNYQDKISFNVEQDPVKGPPVIAVVTADGQVEVPVSRCCETSVAVPAAGKTLAQVETDLTAKLGEDYYKEPKVQLRLVDRSPRAGQILISGPVRLNSIQIPIGKTLTVFEALLMAGPSEFANMSKVTVNRVDPKTNRPREYVIDVEEVEKGAREKDMELRDGDRILVKEKFWSIK